MLDRFAPPSDGESDRQRRLRLSAGGLALTWVSEARDPDERLAMELALDTLAEATKRVCAACP